MIRKIKIVWKDAVIFSPKNNAKELHEMETTGLVEMENDNYFLIKDPITTRISDGKEHPEKRPTFYFIPKGMIKSVKIIE